MSDAEALKSVGTMSPDELSTEIIRLAAAQVGANPAGISVRTHFVNDLGYDSLDRVEFALTLEERFDIALGDEEAESIHTVGAALEKVQELLATAGSRSTADCGPACQSGQI
jgi:acyl carrier protein